MIYLLGGAARTGKTRMAREFLAQTGIPFFSLDFLMMGFANGLPEYGVDPEADELSIAEQLGPVIKAMATAMIEEEVDYLMEGVQLHPRYAWELREQFPGLVRACFVGFACADTAAKLQEIRRFGGGADDWLRDYSDEQLFHEVERLKELSARLRDACGQYGLKYVEASSDLAGTATGVIRYLAGMETLQENQTKGAGFVDARTFLGRTVDVAIDRPLGSKHPEWGFVYSVNYGYVPDTPAPDGEDLDVYVLGVFEPVATFTGECIAVVHRLDDDDDKLVVVPAGVSYTAEQIAALV
jgi:hypothetical protein